MKGKDDYLADLRELIQKEAKTIRAIASAGVGISQARTTEEKKMVNSQIESMKTLLKRTTEDISSILDDMSVIKPLPISQVNIQKTKPQKDYSYKSQAMKVGDIYEKGTPKKSELKREITELERNILKRLKKKDRKIKIVKEKKPSRYIRTANKFFGDYAKELVEKKSFAGIKRDIIKSNLKFIPSSYVSIILFTTFISVFAGFFIFLFFLFFSIGIDFPFIHIAETGIGQRFLQTFWILIAVPLITFIATYTYPSLEKGYLEGKINQELPFATIHMSAISGSLVEPSKIFRILIETKEYPFLEREFIKLMNELNVYGYDFVTALRNVGFNSASTKLSELFNGIATTVNSGGDLQEFFEKRAQSLLFDYRLEREKYTKTAETFMDIYISLVIAAPMILMLLLIMMRVSGLGIALSTSSITLIMILGVGMLNVLFLVFLQLKQPSG